VQKWWSILFGAVLLACTALYFVAPVVGWWLPPYYSSFGWDIYLLFYVILAVTGVVFLAVEAVLVYALYRYAARDGQKAEFVHGNHRLELIWTAVPAFVLLLLTFSQLPAWAAVKGISFWPGVRTEMPAADQFFEVSARQFEWRMRYPSAERMNPLTEEWKKAQTEPKGARVWDRHDEETDVRVVNQVHVWKDGKVRIYLKTRDVLHSFFLPHVPIKQDALPGKTIPVWFDYKEANTRQVAEGRWEDGWRYDAGKKEWVKDPKHVWELVCAELCGWGHYKMGGRVYVHENKEEYEAWLKHAAEEQNRRTP
jgi:cytochrome c oxidase subunit 2